MKNIYTNLILVIICIIIIKIIHLLLIIPKTLKQVEPQSNEIYNERSKFQQIRIADINKLGRVLFLDNELQLSENDEAIYHELLVHFPAIYVPNLNVENVLIVGGGDLMTLREVMKYSTIKNVIMLEIDPKMIEVSKKYFNTNDYKNDKRVKIIYGDAYKTIDTVNINFDLCIIDTTEDNTNNLSIDRKEFFIKCKNKLKLNGICVKNGDFSSKIFTDVFGNFIIYGSYIESFDCIYKFTVSVKGNQNLIYYEIPIFNWILNGVRTKKYNIENHTNYVIWDYASTLKSYKPKENNISNYRLM